MKLSGGRRPWILSALAVVVGAALLNAGFTYHYNLHHVDPLALEKELRTEVPVGTSFFVAEEILRHHGLRVYYEPDDHSINATARDVRGSNFFIRRDVSFTMSFDQEGKLRAIEEHEYLTGP